MFEAYSDILGPKTPARRVQVKSLLVVVLINASQPAKVDCSHTRLEHLSATLENEGGSATIIDASLSACIRFRMRARVSQDGTRPLQVVVLNPSTCDSARV